jgi:hypothetical protein
MIQALTMQLSVQLVMLTKLLLHNLLLLKQNAFSAKCNLSNP